MDAIGNHVEDLIYVAQRHHNIVRLKEMDLYYAKIKI